jgi:hypothetical protein
MARFITCLILLYAFITLTSAQSVGMINTPAGPINQGVTIVVTWTLIAPPKQPGVLQVVNKNTQDTKTISDKLDLNAKELDWVVDVDPGTYHFTLIDEAGGKFSGPFDVVAPKSSQSPKSPKSPAKSPPPPAATPPTPPPAALVEGTTSSTPAGAAQSNQPEGNFASTISAYSPLLGLTSIAVFMIQFA